MINDLIGELKKIANKETLLFRVAEASVSRPDDLVKEVVFPAVGGEQTLLDLVAEYKSGSTTPRTSSPRSCSQSSATPPPPVSEPVVDPAATQRMRAGATPANPREQEVTARPQPHCTRRTLPRNRRADTIS